jgi:hypothetical protein
MSLTLLVLSVLAVQNERPDPRDFWSLRPLQDPAPPPVKNADWVQSPIDRFILARLEAEGIAPAPRADRRTLIRRAAYDLTGLPPAPEEVEAFVADDAPDAFEKLVERLLASPRYGERWARHWLDLARYADTKEWVVNEERRLPFAYTYRDWVIRALNEDLPYERFVTLQIAADLVPDPPNLAAMGFMTVGRSFLNQQPDIVADRIDVITRGLLGLSVDCARCHNHFYDPIPTKDYYSLFGILAGSRMPGLSELPVVGEPAAEGPELEAYRKALSEKEEKLAQFRRERHGKVVEQARKPEKIAEYLLGARELEASEGVKPRDVARQRKINAKLLERWAGLLKKAKEAGDPAFAEWFAEKSDEAAARFGKRLAEQVGETPLDDPLLESMRRAVMSATDVPADQVDDFLQENDRDRLRTLKKELDAVQAMAGAPARAMALKEGEPVSPRVYVRGDPNSPGDEVPRRFLSALSGPGAPEGIDRLGLARAIVSPENPLTARVLVNRVWMHHFGEGIVLTPSDFGTRGDRPTHPELLDWLARRFLEGGGSLKKLHRAIMLSSVYQQAVREDAEARRKDPENRLAWSANRRRLDFEQMRDTLLAAAGTLDATMGGPAVSLTSRPFSRRRTIYGLVDRLNLENLYRAFDFPIPDQHNPKRYQTTVPQQALFLMNSPFVQEQARALAARPEIAGEPDAARRIAALYRRVLGRGPTAREAALGLEFVSAVDEAPAQDFSNAPAAAGPDVWEVYAQALLSSNESMFLD